ncbi:MAG: hypothetical protein K2R98_24365 [Gemmataceae bacterium]|nr:hypothetical protein [Gemmataceae bacterium]
MNSSETTPDDARGHFWSVVKECLVQFHQRQPGAARAQVKQFRKKVDNLPAEQMELYYHSEPFDVACRLAKHPLSVKAYLTRYLEIRDEGGVSGSHSQPHPGPRDTGGITLDDIRAVKQLADKIGAEKVKHLAQVLAK